ncbi:class I SAM-dependent methyltransferase [Pelagicoccus sp. SDUM812002]|uniref:class I SAM-dependent methyltransferase n=1 Tax=Pelagicoccus sp. SDUM812002 TaxID=3041266 RepID=UPI00280F5580|nr:class I SAM-dependent methyltransferase [Pelagicoccus sp. SDUM812002]MDQ8184350.1 class I SAM-dependent methyltransferase [Pelagicoccus sp. SDUM812002]
MPIRELYLDLTTDPLPIAVRNFLEAADTRCDEFFDTGANKKLPRFLPADYTVVYRALKALQDEGDLLGNRFCEWGSGLGTATCLASLLDFEAYGIEIESELVKRARALADEHDLPAQFLETSFLPEGFDFLYTQGARQLLAPHNALQGGYQYDDADWEIDDIDLFYVYPWPEEQESNLELFEALATDGAYMICFYGPGDVCFYQKV